MINSTYVFYDGPSTIDNKPILGIITGLTTPSSNSKTGTVLQTWIISKDHDPIAAVNNNQDYSVCGNCPLRKNICYVNLMPLQGIWSAYYKGKTKPITEDAYRYIKFARIPLRLGSYGNPDAIPFEAWERLLAAAPKHMGYTHQWRTTNPIWKNYLMASVETGADKQIANASGWATYRIISHPDYLESDERFCPNLENEFITCSRCGLCNGNRGNIATTVSGLQWKQQNFTRLDIANGRKNLPSLLSADNPR